jgi:hypothetical protein
MTCPPKTGAVITLDFHEAPGTHVTKRESFWSNVPLEKDSLSEHYLGASDDLELLGLSCQLQC